MARRMSPASGRPAPTPVDTRTPLERAQADHVSCLRGQARAAEGLAQLITQTTAHRAEALAAMADSIGKGAMPSTWEVKNAAIAESRWRALYPFIREGFVFETFGPAKISETMEKIRVSLVERLLMNARGAVSSGDMNSTCSISRAFGLAEMSAIAELVEDMERAVRDWDRSVENVAQAIRDITDLTFIEV